MNETELWVWNRAQTSSVAAEVLALSMSCSPNDISFSKNTHPHLVLTYKTTVAHKDAFSTFSGIDNAP
jgi:hypothetical protein